MQVYLLKAAKQISNMTNSITTVSPVAVNGAIEQQQSIKAAILLLQQNITAKYLRARLLTVTQDQD